MKLIALFLIIGMSISYAGSSYSQVTTLNLKLENKTVREVFKVIEKNSEYIFLYNRETLDPDRVVSINAEKETISNVLDKLFQGTDNTYKVSDRQVYISKVEKQQKSVVVEAKQQQKKIIRGTVVDQKGESVIGANVIEKGTTNGTVTDVEGKFTLPVSQNAILVISYIGFLSQEINTAGRSNVQTIVLEEDLQMLNEVVAIGYGTMKKSDLTGSVSSVSNKQFKDQPIKTVQDLLQGRAPGVQVTTLSGMPGVSPKVRIRGTTSINKSSDPLYVIDGIVSSNGLEQINPTDIQSMEVLKDASATAIYGSRGANGVVLVTTRRGVEGQAQITFDAAVGYSEMMNKPDLLNAYEYATALNDIMGSMTIPAGDLEAYKNGTKGIDWVDLMTQTGISRDYKLSISGGTAKNRYFVSGNYLDWDAVTITTNHKRYGLRANIDSEVTPWLTMSANLNAARVHNHNGSVYMSNIFNYSPTMEMKNEETGVYNKDPYNAVTMNPYGQRVSNTEDNYRYHLNASGTLLFKIVQGLTFSLQGGYNYHHNPLYTFVSKYVQPGQINSMYNASIMNLYWQNTNNLTYSKTIGDHSFTATGVWELSKAQTTAMNISGSNLNNEEIVGYWNVRNAANRDADNSYSEESMVSGLVRLIYNYKSRYMLTGTLRADGSSKFVGDNKWGYFPSLAAAWDIVHEDFMNEQDIFQQLKLRASYGVTGNQAIGRYSTLGMLSPNGFNWGGSSLYTGYWGDSFATPNLSWEKTHQYNMGLDFSILDGRMNFTLDWFQKNTKDLLFQKRVPMYNGGGTFWVNQGEIKNSGIDFAVTAYPLRQGGEFSWETTFNTSYLKNEVMDLAGEEFILDAYRSEYGGYMQILKPGSPYGSFYLYKWKGFDENGANLFEKQDGTLTTSPTGADQYIMGQSEPKFTFGWNNIISWKNWNLNIFFNAATGFNRLNMSRFNQTSKAGMYRFVRLRDAYFKSWDHVDNKADALYPSLTNPNSKNFGNSDFWLEDASFLKIKNISIAYTIPKNVVKFANIQLSLSAQNLVTFTKYTGMDPEVYNQFNGIDEGAYPVPRTFTLGAKINF